jgi:hypothetical protein
MAAVGATVDRPATTDTAANRKWRLFMGSSVSVEVTEL